MSFYDFLPNSGSNLEIHDPDGFFDFLLGFDDSESGSSFPHEGTETDDLVDFLFDNIEADQREENVLNVDEDAMSSDNLEEEEEVFLEDLDFFLAPIQEIEGSGHDIFELWEDNMQVDDWEANLESPPERFFVFAPKPAAKSFVEAIPSLTVRDESLTCGVCSEDFLREETANKLPCSHFYHGECILPWLAMRHTCPLCRYELPTEETMGY